MRFNIIEDEKDSMKVKILKTIQDTPMTPVELVESISDSDITKRDIGIELRELIKQGDLTLGSNWTLTRNKEII